RWRSLGDSNPCFRRERACPAPWRGAGGQARPPLPYLISDQLSKLNLTSLTKSCPRDMRPADRGATIHLGLNGNTLVVRSRLRWLRAPATKTPTSDRIGHLQVCA